MAICCSELRAGEAGNSARFMLILSTAADSRVVELGGRPITVGGGDGADVVVAEPSISRVHARFQRDGDVVSVEDLGSRNGTVVNGERVERAEMRSGDIAVLGNVVACLQLAPPAHAAALGLSTFEAIRGRFEHECARARTFNRPLSLVFFRSDRAIGEGTFATSWASRLRFSDLAGVYDERSILVLMPETDAAVAELLARDLVSATTPEAKVVAGIASYPDSACTPDELLARAMAAAAEDGGAMRSSNVAAGEPLPDFGIDLRTELQRHEAGLIMRALRKTNGHQRRAAALLKLPLRTFERKLKDLGLNRAGLS